MILNLTQHVPSIDQMMEGVGDPADEAREIAAEDPSLIVWA